MTEDELKDLPKELRDQLRDSTPGTTESELSRLFADGKQRTLNDVLIDYWKIHKRVLKRASLASALAVMVKRGSLRRAGKGVYVSKAPAMVPAAWQAGSGEAVAYACPAGCGCLWRDNGDETMSLYGLNSKSCDVCEWLPLADLDTLYTHPQPAQQWSVPEGWKLVPDRPTGPMLDAWFEAERPGNADDTDWYPAYEAMLKTAPEPPQPEGDGWIKCSERLPTDTDADVDNNVWVHDKAMFNAKYRQCLARWNTVGQISDYTHWKPTGLKRPNPPAEGAE